MSIRTIIEINHDYISRLEKPGELEAMITNLLMGQFMPELNDGEKPEIAPGVRVLMRRHHSSDVTIKSDWAEVKL